MTLRADLNDVACGLLAIFLALGVGLAQVSDPDAVKRRALALAQAGNYAEARTDLERLVSERPNDRLARKLLARVLIAAGAALARMQQTARSVGVRSHQHSSRPPDQNDR